MIALRVIVFLLGAALAIWTVLTAITTVVLPRGSRSVINSVVFGSSRVIFGFIAKRRPTYEQEDRVLALHAPFGLIGIVAAWLILVLIGFMFMFWALEPDIGWSGAFAESGSSITTLGFVAADATAERALAFIEAGVGLLLLTLLITYLPTIYSAFARRETKVTLLEVRAGSPPSAIEFLLRYHRIGWLETLDEEWRQWEAWFADIEESHTSIPSLVFFRSPDPDRSWVTAAGAILDAAALDASAIPSTERAAPGVCIRAGYIALRRIADFFGIAYDPDPAPDDPISITRGEFDDAIGRLEAGGVELVDDRDQAWADFVGWRVNYDTVLLALAELVHAPYAPWTSDRSTPDHTPPKIAAVWPGLRSRRATRNQSRH